MLTDCANQPPIHHTLQIEKLQRAALSPVKDRSLGEARQKPARIGIGELALFRVFQRDIRLAWKQRARTRGLASLNARCFVAEQDASEQDALKKRMGAKSFEFERHGASLY